jgi:hypothetical protein
MTHIRITNDLRTWTAHRPLLSCHCRPKLHSLALVGGLQTANRERSITRLHNGFMAWIYVVRSNGRSRFTSTPPYIFMTWCSNAKATLPLTSDNCTCKIVSLEWMGWHTEPLFRKVFIILIVFTVKDWENTIENHLPHKPSRECLSLNWLDLNMVYHKNGLNVWEAIICSSYLRTLDNLYIQRSEDRLPADIKGFYRVIWAIFLKRQRSRPFE